MDLNPYVESVRNGVIEASSLADDHTRDVAHRLGGAIDSATRLALIRALSDAAAILSADLAPTSVEVRMAGGDPDLVVRVPPPETSPTLIMAQPPAPEDPSEPAEPDLGEEATARISLRLPASVKAKVDEMADRDGISTNAWLQRAIMDALGDPRSRSTADTVRGLLGSVGPFGPDGPFGAHGVFGPHGPLGEGDRHRPEPPPRPPTRGADRSRGNVRGWVR